jgi:hypothetical protein
VAATTNRELGLKHGQVVTPNGLTNTSGTNELLRTYVAQQWYADALIVVNPVEPGTPPKKRLQSEDGEVCAASAYLGGPTPIGTLTIGIGNSEESSAFWLSLGRPVGSGSILNQGIFRRTDQTGWSSLNS